MQKFIAEIRKLTRRVSPNKIHPFLKRAHEVTSAAIMRDLKRRKLNQRELKHARKFLELTRYSKKGVWPERYAQLYDIALQMAQNKSSHVLGHIEETANKAIQLARTKSYREGSGGLSVNSAISILYSARNTRAFLDRDDIEGKKQDIAVSKPSPQLKARLYKYLETKEKKE